jgi:hypothetical protein
MPEKLHVSRQKTLKLNNALIREIGENDVENLERVVTSMETYMKIKGTQPIGPLIQFAKATVNKNGVIEVSLYAVRQANNFIHSVEPPYRMESVLRVKNCLYTRFIGKEIELNYAYDKLRLYAYEEDITLEGNSYTIFVDENDDGLVADVFMECKVDA